MNISWRVTDIVESERTPMPIMQVGKSSVMPIRQLSRFVHDRASRIEKTEIKSLSVCSKKNAVEV
jgi:hypothetical protein